MHIDYEDSYLDEMLPKVQCTGKRKLNIVRVIATGFVIAFIALGIAGIIGMVCH